MSIEQHSGGPDGETETPKAAVTEGGSKPLAAPSGGARRSTPMMTQYLAIKRAHPNALLFYRMGDFYEMFFDDAVKAAAALDIALTKRGKHDGADIPMCGVPVHSHETYLERLIRRGFKVAICEQVEDAAEARKRGGKAVVARDVVRLVTPGTLTEDSLLDSRAHNHLAALARVSEQFGLAWLDVSTGDFTVAAPQPGELADLLAQVAPRELLAADRLVEAPDLFELFAEWKPAVTVLPAARFESVAGERRMRDAYGVATLDGLGGFGRGEIAAAGALIDYVDLTQRGHRPRLGVPRRQGSGAVMIIDAATRRNLELVRAHTGSRTGSLLATVDRTQTGAGARLLAARLTAPLTDPQTIGRRLDMVEVFHSDAACRDGVRETLRGVPDIERALARIGVGRGGPRDLAALRDGLVRAGQVRSLVAGLRHASLAEPAEDLVDAVTALGDHEVLIDRLGRALAEELPFAARDGGFIAQGYAPALDDLRVLRDENRRLVVALQDRYRAATGVNALKVKHNNVLGYFVEVPGAHSNKLFGDDTFTHRQTMASAARFATAELRELEDEIARAADRALALELELFADLVDEVTGRANEIADTARALAEIDVAVALATLAVEGGYCRPRVDDSFAFSIAGGRHPVVEATAASDAAGFVANDCDLERDGRLWLLTGPNMAGKSTFLRQNALIAILAHAGSYVPASSAQIGAIDRLFSRVGAADDLARGRSTFMVEMVETAVILNQAGPRSFVILDEIGRGTATYDGMSIAWAAIEHLHDRNRCRGLFATHFHELTNLAARLDSLSCHTMRVREWKGEAVFLYEVGPGAADRSYGIHVARLAGLPETVVARASVVLDSLERNESASTAARLADELPLFAPRPPAPAPSGRSRAVEELAAIEPDELTPRRALEMLYRLKSLSDD